jgi:hypothetical protein
MSVQHPNIVRCFKCSVVRPHRRMKGVADGMEPADSALLQEPGPGPHQASEQDWATCQPHLLAAPAWGPWMLSQACRDTHMVT